MRVSRKTRPLLRGLRIGPGWWANDPDEPDQQRLYLQIAVWCPFCAKMHCHGWDPALNGRHAEHRVAHCHNPESLFDKTGYFISPLRQSDAGYEQHVRRPGIVVQRPRVKRREATSA